MKKFVILFFIISISVINAQFKDSEKPLDVRSGILRGGSSESIFGFINPDNFSMHHSFDLSYTTMGSAGMALGVYTNSMAYKFNDKLNMQADISLVNTPYNSFGPEVSKQINGVYLSRLQLNFKPTDNMSVMVQYRNMPMSYYSPYYYGGSSFYRGGMFDNFGFGY